MQYDIRGVQSRAPRAASLLRLRRQAFVDANAPPLVHASRYCSFLRSTLRKGAFSRHLLRGGRVNGSSRNSEPRSAACLRPRWG